MKIIQTYNFKKHMEAHKKEFLVPYEELIDYVVRRNLLNFNKEKICKLTVEFPFSVGYCNLVKTNSADRIIYAKRKGREIYTRFVLNRTPIKVNKCVFILNQNHNKDNEYYLITMFPGENCVKEPQDKYIQSEEELKESLNFWAEHAIIFQEDVIDTSTVVEECPYYVKRLIV